jgi:hypothetical protein
MTGDPHSFNKSLTSLGDFSCDFKNIIDVETPEVYVAAGATYDQANYMYISEFGRYYYAKARAGTGNVITFECQSDPLMSFKSQILACPAVISRNPWHFDLYVPDPKLPIEARSSSAILKFTGDHFSGTNNSYILTTIGSA